MLILIEGVDGSGKNTQSKLLTQKLNVNYYADLVSFPQYDSFMGKEVANYLNGGFGSLNSLNPKFPSMLYALDRMQLRNELSYFAPLLTKFLVLDRYTQSNIAHQCAKLEIFEEQNELENWIEKLEYGVLGLPKTNINFFLDMPIEFSQQLILEKEARSYTEKKKDLHEADIEYMQRSRNYYIHMAKRDNWNIIQCVENNYLRSIESINEEIYDTVNKFLVIINEQL